MYYISTINNPNFGYTSPLKTLYKKGKLPAVKYGFYGGKLNKKSVSLEHLLPHSQGGETNLDNLVLATKENNNRRGSKPIKHYVNIEQVKLYLKQFSGVLTGNLDGEKYIQGITETLKKLGVVL